MSDMKRLLRGFTDSELNDLLLAAVYKECIFNRPHIIAEAVKDFEGGMDSDKIDGFIGFEKMRLIAEFAESVGAQVGVLAESDNIGDVVGTC